MAKLTAEGRQTLEKDIQDGNINNFLKEYFNAFNKGDVELLEDIRDQLINSLRKYPAKINHQNPNGNTLLHLAFLNDAPRLAKALLELDLQFAKVANIDLLIHIKNKAGKTPFDIAREKKHRECLALIGLCSIDFCIESLKEGNINNFIKSYLDLSMDLILEVRNKVTAILRKNPKLRDAKNKEGNNILHLAILCQCPGLTNALLELEWEFIGEKSKLLTEEKNTAGKTPLAEALETKNTEAVKILVKHNTSFYLERDLAGTYLTAQYAHTAHLGDLLSRGQSLNTNILAQVLKIIRENLKQYSDPFEKREYLNRVAIRLIGLRGPGCDIDFKQWAKHYANSVSQISELCTIDACFNFGEDFGESVNYLLIHARALLELLVVGGDNPILLKEFQIAINTAKIDQETTLLNLLRQNNQTMMDHHVNGLFVRLNTLGQICYPGGWPGQSGVPGHAIYVDMDLTDSFTPQTTVNSCAIDVFNLGGGLEKDYNKPLFVAENTVMPVMATVKIDEVNIKLYLNSLVWANLNGTTEKQIDEALSLIYASGIFGQPVKTSAKKEQAEIIQPIGNCIVKNYLFAMRTRIGDGEYKAVYKQILNIIFEQIQSYCGTLPRPQEVALALQASEIVFKDVSRVDIQYMTVFRNPPLVCQAKESKERKEELGNKQQTTKSLAELSISFGLLRVNPVTYHRGQQLKHEEAPTLATTRFVI